jgi:hypothetical protein
VADDDGSEVLDLGVVEEPQSGPGPAPPPRRKLPRRAVLALGGLAVVGGGVAVARSRDPGATAATPAPGRTPNATTPTTPTLLRTAPERRAAAQVVVTQLPKPPLDAPQLDLFGFSNTAVVRVELATGRVTQTALPPLSDTTVWFAPVRSGVLVHRDDGGASYLIPDGRIAQEAPPALAAVGPLLPGPDLDHVWVMGRSGSTRALVLVGIDGRPTGTSVALAAFPQESVMPDGGGYPLVSGIGGAYWARPQGMVRVTTGAVLASGPTGWLVVDCDEHDSCSGAFVDRRATRRTVPRIVSPDIVPSIPGGAVSPDGGTAALYVGDPALNVRLVLIDLATGSRRPTDVNLVGGAVSQSLVWSPTGRWLFAVDSSARMVAVDPGTGRVSLVVPGTIVPALPVVQEVAVR